MGNVGTYTCESPASRVAIHQPNYLPWVGYFDKIARVDTFVLFDDVQLPQGKSFCSRVKIKGSRGPQWLTVPIKKKSGAGIHEIEIVKNGWTRKHVRTIEQVYSKAPYFEEFWPQIRGIFTEDWQLLADMNCALIETVSQLFGLRAKFVRSSEFKLRESPGEDRILEILGTLKATTYVSGQGEGSRRYVNDGHFRDAGIDLCWQTFQHPVYPQMTEPFDSHMSIIDMLLMHGNSTSMFAVEDDVQSDLQVSCRTGDTSVTSNSSHRAA
jgi:hypothetical protein